MKSFITFCLFLIIGSLAGGFTINFFRDKPLPMVYRGKAERLADEVALVARDNALADSEMSMASSENPAVNLPEVLDGAAMKEIVTKGETIVLDARPALFHRLGHIPNALSLPREDFANAYAHIREKLESDKKQPLVVYCSDTSCEDSKLLRDALLKLGYTNVVIYEGGWADWEK